MYICLFCLVSLNIHYDVHRSTVMNPLQSWMNPIHAVACHETMKTKTTSSIYSICAKCKLRIQEQYNTIQLVNLSKCTISED
jgi:hypothetical protein